MTTSSESRKFDAKYLGKQVEQLAQVLLPSTQLQLLCIPRNGGTPVAETFDTQYGLDAPCQWVQDHNTAKRNIYFTVNGVAEVKGSKTSKEDHTELRLFHCDIDPDIAAGYAAGREALLGVVKEMANKCSLIVDSGNGVQAYIKPTSTLRLGSDISVEEAEELNQRLGHAIGKPDSAFNVDRIMRLPGTINWSSDKKLGKGYPEYTLAKILYIKVNYMLGLDELRQSLRPIPEKAGTRNKQKGGVFKSQPQSISAVELKDLQVRVKSHRNNKLRARWEGDGEVLNSKGEIIDDMAGDRSRMDYSMTSLLAIAGFGYHEAYALLKEWPHGKVGEREDKYFDDMWRKVRVPNAQEIFNAAGSCGALPPLTDPAERLRVLVMRYALIENGKRVVDLYAIDPGYAVRKLDEFRAVHCQPVKVGNIQNAISIATLWQRQAAVFRDTTFDPKRHRKRVIEREGECYYNQCSLPEHQKGGGDSEPFLDFVRYLIPDSAECDWFLKHLAHKVQNPEVPGPATVLVAHKVFGTGRGFLFEVLGRLFGISNVRNVEFNDFMGRHYQSQYNSWLSESLVVTIEEARGAGTKREQRLAYERLKQLTDPRATEIEIKRKGLDNTMETRHATVFMATNHGDALVLPERERRFAVLSQPGEADKRSNSYFAGMQVWLDNPANVAALWRSLLTWDTVGYSPFEPPPNTRGKVDMHERNKSELELAIEAVLEEPPRQCMTMSQICGAVSEHLHPQRPPVGWEGVVRAVVVDRCQRYRHKRTEKTRKVKIDGRVQRIWLLAAADKWLTCTPAQVAAEVRRQVAACR